MIEFAEGDNEAVEAVRRKGSPLTPHPRDRISSRQVAADLAAGVYRAVIDIDCFAELIDLWEAHVSMSAGLPAELTEAIERHVSISEPLLADYMRDMQTSDEMIGAVLRDTAPSALVSRTRLVMAVNTAGREFLGIEAGQYLDATQVDPMDVRAFERAFRDLEKSGEDTPILLRLGRGSDRRLVAITPLRLPGTNTIHARLRGLDLAIPDRAFSVLASTYGLTRRETELLKAMLDGRGGAEIAREQGIREDTVKKLIRSIREKTGTPGEAQMLRLVASLARFTGDDVATAGRPSVTNPAGRTYVLPQSHEVMTIGGRRIEFYRAGARNGFPVLLHHGLITGIACPPEFSEALARQGLSLFAPFRPGYGVSQKADKPNRPDATAELLIRFADALRLDRFVTLSMSGGAFFGLGMHERYPDRVMGHVVSGGYFPISREELDGHRLPHIRALFTSTADHPKAARFLVTCGYRLALQSGPGRLLNSIFRRAGHGRDLVSESRAHQNLASGVPIVCAQGMDTYVEEISMVASDMSRWAAGLTQAVTVVHGAQEAVFPIELARVFCRRAQSARLVELSRHGYLAAFSDCERVVEELAAIVPRTASRHPRP